MATVEQFVSFNDRAWHAGKSGVAGARGLQRLFHRHRVRRHGRSAVRTGAVRRRLRALLPMLLEAYPQITRERIVGHSDVAPGRKTDPGAVVRLVAGALIQESSEVSMFEEIAARLAASCLFVRDRAWCGACHGQACRYAFFGKDAEGCLEIRNGGREDIQVTVYTGGQRRDHGAGHERPHREGLQDQQDVRASG